MTVLRRAVPGVCSGFTVAAHIVYWSGVGLSVAGRVGVSTAAAFATALLFNISFDLLASLFTTALASGVLGALILCADYFSGALGRCPRPTARRLYPPSPANLCGWMRARVCFSPP